MIINDFVDIMWGNITTEIKKRKSIHKNSYQENGVAAAKFMFMMTSKHKFIQTFEYRLWH